MESLYEKLKAYGESDYYGFHMPGHKRNRKLMENEFPYQIDITEIEGFDDLHHAKGILKDAQERAAGLFHADETYFLVNGSTVGILSALLGSVSRGGRILAARNCHKSVYHAIEMMELEPVYLYPEFDRLQGISGEIRVGDVKKYLMLYPDIQAVVIVSPTYDGVVSDVAGIAEVAHEYGIPLIVDEAHGAHFGFHPYFPKRANMLGADVVVNSLHKTLPAPTQTALLHINGALADRESICRYLDMLQSSSPSYPLMAGIDECVRLLSGQGDRLFEQYTERLRAVRSELRELRRLKLLEMKAYDRSKILISVRNCKKTSKEIYKLLLKKYQLQMEMTAGSYVLGMTSVADTEEGFWRLKEALKEIDADSVKNIRDGEVGTASDFVEEAEADDTVDFRGSRKTETDIFALDTAEVIYSCAKMRRLARAEKMSGAAGGRIRRLPWKDCEGCISAEYAYLYPPGIPILVPGERVTPYVVQKLLTYQRLQFGVDGVKEEGFLEVWIDG